MFTNIMSEKYIPRLQISKIRSFVFRKHKKKIIKNKEIKFVFVELRGEKKLKELNQYMRRQRDSERGRRWVKGCTAHAVLSTTRN
jgi:hypothetical protein